MSDYIRKSALMKYLWEYKWEFALGSDFSKAIEMVDAQPTLDEKEIIHNALKRARKNLDKELLEIDKKIMRNAYSDEERLDADGFAKGIRYAYIEIRKECGINE